MGVVGVVVASRFQAWEPITVVGVVSGGCCVRGWEGGECLLKGREMRVFLTRLLLAAAGMMGAVF
jgi:hypothetical protein